MKTALLIIGSVFLYLLIGSTLYFAISAVENSSYDSDTHVLMMFLWIILIPILLIVNINEVYKKIWELTVALFVLVFKRDNKD